MSYRNLADAAAVTGDARYAGGGTKIWYMKPEVFRDFIMGPDWIQERKDLHGYDMPTPQTLSDTHILLGEVGERDLNQIWAMMQGENWSPQREAQSLIKGKGLRHTSMSVGDVIQVGSRLFMVAGTGFEKLGSLRHQSLRLARQNENLRAALTDLLLGEGQGD